MPHDDSAARAAMPDAGAKTHVPDAIDEAPHGPDDAVAALPSTRRRWSVRRVVLGVMIVLAVLVANLVFRPAQFYRLTPGPAPDITTRMTGDIRNPEFGRHGHVYFTTVKVSDVNWLEYLRTRLFTPGDDSLVPAGATTDQDKAAAAAAAGELMRQSKQIAWQVAVTQVTGVVPAGGMGAEVLTVTSGSAAAVGGLLPGDVITSIGDHPVTSADAVPDMVAVAARHTTLTVRRTGGEQTLPVTLDVVDGHQRLGVQLGTALPADAAAGLDVRTEGVGGPSGGLMFTLAFTDALATGDLTAGRNIAGTGTIALDGTVGPIGGVKDKVAGARRAGAQVFFAPTADAAAAASVAPAGMTVVPVASYVDAVNWLCGHGATSSVCTRQPIPRG